VTGAAAPAIELAAPSRGGRIAAALPAALLLVFVLVALGAPLLAPADPARQSLLARLRPPGFTAGGVTHWLGTDEVGRDLLSRVLHGARVSLLVAFLSVCVSGTLGSVLGMVAGLRRGLAEIAIMRGVDVMLSIPPILLAIITVAVLGPGLQNLILVLGLTRWPRYTRVAYGQTLGVATLPFITAARLGGARSGRLLFRHVLPNILAPLVVVATLELGLMVLFEAGLSFLGLGIQPPTPSWGSIMAVGRSYLATAWWIATLPGLCLFLLVLAVNLLGDQLRDRLDPRSTVR
jgi:ABC-type dipeptide/oligopeptide/nickel transport system permease subunit